MREWLICGAAIMASAAWAAGRAQPQMAPGLRLGSGLSLDGFDRTVRPQDDLYRFAGGEWLRKTQIPQDRSNYGAFTMAEDQSLDNIKAIVEEAAKTAPLEPGSDTQKIGDFYNAYMDEARAEQLGLAPLKSELARIDAINSRAALARYLGYAQTLGLGSPVGLYVYLDAKNSTAYVTYAVQSGLGMPDRDYYLEADAKSAEYRKAYLAYLSRIAALAHLSQPAALAATVMGLETRLAKAQWTQVENRDDVKTYNKFDSAGLAKLAPGISWDDFRSGARLPATGPLVVKQPSYIAALGRATAQLPLKDWRAYLKLRLLGSEAPLLGKDFVAADFDFYRKALRGQEVILPRWKRALETMDGSLGEMIGRIYVERHFPPEAKQRMDALVKNLLAAFEQKIGELDWMSPATQAEAHAKLAKIMVKIGYPTKWKSYDRLIVKPGDLVGNALRSATVEYLRQVDKLGRPIDRTEWLVTPQTVNAYYEPTMNEIIFPAAILQPPFFDFGADDAVNYGAIGAVIGHEISHGFDDRGSRFDGNGNLRDWWSPLDAAAFKQRTARLVAQYSVLTAIDDKKANGELTLGENIGDLSGMAVAFRAYQIALAGAEAPVLDGFTGEQRFFLGWGQVWRRKYRDDDVRWRLTVDPHSLSEHRVNIIASNFGPFYAAFGLKEGDKLYRPPAERVKIW
jgi:putative endopeptidase